MKNIKIVSLVVNNFKGLRSFALYPTDNTNIYGTNGTMKTTISDAYHWVLFGKNSNDESDFNIKTLNADNTPIHKLEHSVEIVFDIDGMHTTFRRMLKEKWTRPRGQEKEVFDGHETYYWVNDVPKSQKEYKEFIESIMPESIFKILSNPLYFNQDTSKWGWQQRRAMLFKMVGDISDLDVAGNNIDFKNLINSLVGKNLADLKKELAAKKKKLSDELTFIPSKIDELIKTKPESIDEVKLKQEIELLKVKVASIESQINDSQKAYNEKNQANISLSNQINDLENNITSIKNKQKSDFYNSCNELKNKHSQFGFDIINKESAIKSKDQLITNKSNEIVSIEKELTNLRTQFSEVNAQLVSFDQFSTKCPTCNREFESDDIQEKQKQLTESFNIQKAKTLEEINTKGQAIKSKLAVCQSELDKLKSDKVVIENELSEIKAKRDALNYYENTNENAFVYNETEEIKQLNRQITELQSKKVIVDSIDNSILIYDKNTYQANIDELNKKLGTVDVIKNIELRIKELKDQESLLAQNIADLEKQLFCIEEFTKQKVSMTEEKINSMFSLVRFKMYNQQINGGFDETCEVLIDGVPFSDLNTAKKINAGLDIINALSKFFGVNMPIILDNRESCVSILPFNGQIINLFVSEKDKVLRIENL